MNWDDRLNSITTGMTIEITETKIICKKETESKTDQYCIKYLRQVAKRSNHAFVTSMSEFYNTNSKIQGTNEINKDQLNTHLYR